MHPRSVVILVASSALTLACGGPVVHEEIADPTRPGELPITYGVGSTGTRTGVPDDYWTRLVWVR